MAVAILNQTVADWAHDFPLAWSFAHDATGADCLLVFAAFANSHTAIPTCTYNGVAMSAVANAHVTSGDGTIHCWKLASPPAGLHDVVIASPGNYFSDGSGYAVNLTGTNTGTPVASGAAVAGDGPQTASLTLAGTGGLVVGVGSSGYALLQPYTGSPTPTVVHTNTSNANIPSRLVTQAGGSSGATNSLDFKSDHFSSGIIVELLVGTGLQVITAPPLVMTMSMGPETIVTRQVITAPPLAMTMTMGPSVVSIGGAFPQSITAPPLVMTMAMGPHTIAKGSAFPTFPAVLAPGETMTISVQFAPIGAAGARTGALTVTSDATDSPDVAALAGAIPGEITWLHTNGNQVVDESGTNIRLVSANWYGFEGVMMPGGCWDCPYKTITIAGVTTEGVMDRIKRLGFNSIRLPVCIDVTWLGAISVLTDGLDPVFNPDLYSGGTLPANRIGSLAMLDKVVEHATALGLRIILDMHCLARNTDNVAGTQGRWYSTATPGAAGGTTVGQLGQVRNEQQWIDAWVFYANRYANNPIVCGFDLVNEPHFCTWDDDPNNGWPAAAERCAAAIQVVNPRALIIVEGVYSVIPFPDGYTQGCFWSEDLRGVATRPVLTPVPNRVAYSPHDYGCFPHFSAPDAIFARALVDPSLYASWLRTCWGYLIEDNIAPIWIGEYGSYFIAGSGGGAYTATHATKDQLWITVLTKYGNGDFNLDGVTELPVGKVGVGSAYWPYNNETNDNAGIIQANHTTVNQFVLDNIAGMMVGA